MPILRSGDTTRNKEDALLICAQEGKALKLQLNALLDSLEGHIGLPEPAPEPALEPAPVESKEGNFWDKVF